MSHIASEPKSNRTRLIVLLVAALVVLGLVVYAIVSAGTPKASSSDTPAPISSGPSTAAPPVTSPDPVSGFVPNRFTIESETLRDSEGNTVDEPVVSLGRDSDGNIAAPPKDEPRLASWWNEGPLPGSDKGKVVLSIHTYQSGKALGNELFADGKSALAPGDLITLHSAGGQKQQYKFREAKKIWVKDYDVNSDVMVDYDGKPQLVIVICWDHNSSTDEWDSRIMFYADPV